MDIIVAAGIQDGETNISITCVKTIALATAFIDVSVATQPTRSAHTKLTLVGVAKGRKEDGRKHLHEKDGSEVVERSLYRDFTQGFIASSVSG
jgi:hypothetical protein